jgi:hypothetical protein
LEPASRAHREALRVTAEIAGFHQYNFFDSMLNYVHA